MPLHEQLAGAAALVVLTVSLAGWLHAVMRWRAGLPLVPLSPRRPAPWTIVDLLAVFVTYVLAQFAGVIALRQFFGGSLSSLEDATAKQIFLLLLVQGAANLATAVIAVLLITLRVGATVRDLGFSLRELGSDLKLGAVAFCMLAPPVLMLQAVLTRWLPSEHPLVQMLRDRMTGQLFAVGGFVAVIVAPVVEEFVFRVLLQGWLERFDGKQTPVVPADGDALVNPPQATAASPVVTAEVVMEDADANPYLSPPPSPAPDEPTDADFARLHAPPLWPIFISALIFALLHAGNGPDPIPLFFLAVGLGYLYRQTHRITPSMTVHFLLNGVSMTILWIELTFGQ
jgi:membrane protease YdiL (CAAX protease family)